MFDQATPSALPMTRSQNVIQIEHINAQSLLGHFEEIKMLVEERNIDILCISETWLHQEMVSNFINIPNFKVYRCDAGRGGGVCIYVRDTLKSNRISTTAVNNTAVEDVWVTVQSNMLPSFIIGTVYRHPHATSESFEYIEKVFREMSLKKKPLFILGDLNDDLTKSNAKLAKVIKKNKLEQIIDKPTRITENTSSLLDLIITNRPDLILHSDVTPCHVADHELITMTINIKKTKRPPVIKTFRDFKHYDPQSFRELILSKEMNLLNIPSTDNVNKQVTILTEVINISIDALAPYVTRIVRRPPAPWINDDIKRAICDRNEAHQALKFNRHEAAFQVDYKVKKKNVKMLIQSAKRNYFRNKFTEYKNNSDKTWKTVKTLVPQNKLTSDCAGPTQNTEHFNHFFSKIGKLTYEQTTASTLQRNTDRAMFTTNFFRPQPVDVETIILVIKHLRETNAVGADGIALRFIRDSLPAIAHYLTVIINTSLVTGVFPSLWKHGIVTPIFKSGDIDDVNNYRPITILPILSKVLEKIVANQLTSFLEANNLLSKTQHGFRNKLSTETALLQITDEIYNNIDNNQVNLLTLCDLSKAFDSVNHEILLNKLVIHKIDTFWFKSYLDARTQSVRIKDCMSSKQEVPFGVPQGSILGPILFTIFINDLSTIAHNCLLVQYADDSQFLHSDSVNNLNTLIRNTQHTLTQAKLYFDTNGLKLNPHKTQCIFIGSRQNIAKIPNDTTIEFEGCSIKPNTSVNNLGVHLDKYMTFEQHVDKIHRKVMGTLVYLNHIKNQITTETRIMVVQTLVLSIINYCSNIWGSTNKTQMQKVQKLQNFAARVALGNISKLDHISPHIQKLNWLKVQPKCSYDTCVFIYKLIHGNYPQWLMPLQTVGTTSGVVTRQVNSLYVKRSRTDTGARQMEIRGPKLWNMLPDNIRVINSFCNFKTKLKEHLLNNQL